MPQFERTPYANRGHRSGVREFVLGPSSIRVWFIDGSGYEYDYRRPGPAHVEAMKLRAQRGEGLATYINQHVRENYARKL